MIPHGTRLPELVAARESMVQKEKMERIVLPAKFTVMPGFVFRNSKPAVVGVKIIAGRLRAGIKVVNKGRVVGTVKLIQSKNETIEIAEKNDEVAVSIDRGVVGRNIFEKDTLYSYIPKGQFAETENFKSCLSEEEIYLLEEIKKIEAEETEEGE